jgi:hypothetical protein
LSTELSFVLSQSIINSRSSSVFDTLRYRPSWIPEITVPSKSPSSSRLIDIVRARFGWYPLEFFRLAEQKRWRLAPIWPEWNEFDVNNETWDGGGQRKTGSTLASVRSELKTSTTTVSHRWMQFWIEQNRMKKTHDMSFVRCLIFSMILTATSIFLHHWKFIDGNGQTISFKPTKSTMHDIALNKRATIDILVTDDRWFSIEFAHSRSYHA